MKHNYKFLTIMIAMFVSQVVICQEKIILLNEGLWQADNGRISYFENGKIVSNQWFRDINGTKIGDTPDDIIQVNESLIAIAVNWSNIIQFISPDGKAVAATEDVPNNRKLASDGKYVYVSSFGHECMVNGSMVEFKKGFVAKIDINNFKVVAACEVGYEPEGIAYYNGYLFVANTGGYAFQEDHDYESTVSIIDADRMKVINTIDTKQINLYGKMSQSGKYLCINSAGDYYDVSAATVIFDCEAALNGKKCCTSLEFAATYNCTSADGNFYAIGSRYSYYTGEYTFNYITINPETVMNTDGADGVTHILPGTVVQDIQKMSMPYGIYVNPYSGYIYATDAGSFVGAGSLYQWSPTGVLLGKHKVYINPAHFLALKPDSGNDGCPDIIATGSREDTAIYNLHGIRVLSPVIGNIYIQKGKKFIYLNN
ncbi:MAG: hypothetical protein J1F10_03480 [Muribaculaceae bacterium]|nr:hypothetical protein [Muribaculaceae bacterium]